MREKIGRTKPTRAPGASRQRRTKNDGRPPDTIKELLLGKPTKKQKKEVSKLKHVLQVKNLKPKGNPSYPWQNNSCWLDTSLELLHATVSHNFDEFTYACKPLPPGSPLRFLYDMLQKRQNLDPSMPNISITLADQRNKLRSRIVKAKEAGSLSSFEPLFVSYEFYKFPFSN